MSIADAYNPRLEGLALGPGPDGRAPGCWDSYSPERQAGRGGRASSAPSRACKEGRRAVEAALGYEPAQPRPQAGWKALGTLYGTRGRPGDEQGRRWRKARSELSNYQFQLPMASRLGYRYRSDAHRRRRQPGPDSGARPRSLYYQPTTRPGARVPHTRVEQGPASRSPRSNPSSRRPGLRPCSTGVGGEAMDGGGGGNLPPAREYRPRPCHRRRRKGVT